MTTKAEKIKRYEDLIRQNTDKVLKLFLLNKKYNDRIDKLKVKRRK